MSSTWLILPQSRAKLTSGLATFFDTLAIKEGGTVRAIKEGGTVRSMYGSNCGADQLGGSGGCLKMQLAP